MSNEVQAELLLRLAVALLLGSLIGFERERLRHPAGLRTMGMVAIGSCLFTVLGAYVPGHQDPTRIAAQVVTGIGFLGAGAILRHGTNVQGLTTASTVWVVAAVGMCAGFGAYLLAFGGTALVLLALLIFRPMERRLFRRELVVPKEPEPPEL